MGWDAPSAHQTRGSNPAPNLPPRTRHFLLQPASMCVVSEDNGDSTCLTFCLIFFSYWFGSSSDLSVCLPWVGRGGTEEVGMPFRVLSLGGSTEGPSEETWSWWAGGLATMQVRSTPPQMGANTDFCVRCSSLLRFDSSGSPLFAGGLKTLET